MNSMSWPKSHLLPTEFIAYSALKIKKKHFSSTMINILKNSNDRLPKHRK